METWFIFALLSIAVLAGSEISQKISLSQDVNISAITNNFYVWTMQGLVGIVLALILGQFAVTFTPLLILKLIAVGIVYFLGGTFFYTSYKGNSPSISIVLGTISVVISNILGNIFLNDPLSTTKIIGVAFILSAIFFLNFNKSEKFNKYNLYAILGGICFGVAFTLDKSFVINISPFMYLGLMCLTVALVSLITSIKLIVRETKTLVAKNFIPMISSATFGSAFNLFTFFAYKNGANVGIADAMNNSSIFLVIGLEILLLKDKTNLTRKLLAASVALIGIVLIGISK